MAIAVGIIVYANNPSTSVLPNGNIPVGEAPSISDTPAAADQNVIDKGSADSLVNANNQFALDFYSRINDDDRNIFFSPWSISTAFGIAYEGTRGSTADEIRSVFGFPQDDLERRSSFASIQNDLNRQDADYKLHVANALWIMKGFKLLDEYVDTARIYYDSEVANVDFATDESRQTTNKWVKSKTNEKIKDLLPSGSTNEYTQLVITNAIYFKGDWVTQFDKEKTADEDFKVSPDKTVKAPMMKLEETEFNYAETEELQVLEMPYRGDKLSMLVILPKGGLQSLEGSLTVEKLSEWKGVLSKQGVVVNMPKFKLETNYGLEDTLIQMGMPSVFQSGIADLSGINGTLGLFISDAFHKAFVDVNEEGTEAAAATAIIMNESASPVNYFNADHPFIFIIQDNETGNILFMGRVVDPIA